MTTISDIFRSIRLSTLPIVSIYTHHFDGLQVGDATWHGQLNACRTNERAGRWAVTIYLLRPRSSQEARDGEAVSFQHYADSLDKAINEVERLATEWAATKQLA